MNINKKTMNFLFEVLDLNSAKILLQGIEKEKGYPYGTKAITITNREQSMIYLDQVLNSNDVAVLENYSEVKYVTTTEVLNNAFQNKQKAYDTDLFYKHIAIFNKAVSNQNWYKRLKYFLNAKECLTCKP